MGFPFSFLPKIGQGLHMQPLAFAENGCASGGESRRKKLALLGGTLRGEPTTQVSLRSVFREARRGLALSLNRSAPPQAALSRARDQSLKGRNAACSGSVHASPALKGCAQHRNRIVAGKQTHHTGSLNSVWCLGRLTELVISLLRGHCRCQRLVRDA